MWFGTFCIFPYIGNVIIPTDELICFRGVELNHQPDRYLDEEPRCPRHGNSASRSRSPARAESLTGGC